MSGRERAALSALGGIALVTVAWWAAALWPLPPATPEWVARARAACFGATASGLPNSGGWILLIGQPLTMTAALLLIWGGAVRDGLRAAARGSPGRWLLGGTALLALALAGAAYRTVEGARAGQLYGYGASDPAGVAAWAAALPRSAREAPELALADHRGERVHLDGLAGRVVLVTFAYGKCDTVCPLIVRSVLEAQAQLAEVAPVVLVVTLDPWRDAPGRLPHIASHWRMGEDARLLGGEVEEVERVLDAWQVSRSRDPRSGEIVHPSLVHILDREGRIAFTTTGGAAQIVQLVRRL
jgi:cytochrome oxidase Cu insertion factor (SCO1/SenC/PrrC family)